MVTRSRLCCVWRVGKKQGGFGVISGVVGGLGGVCVGHQSVRNTDCVSGGVVVVGGDEGVGFHGRGSWFGKIHICIGSVVRRESGLHQGIVVIIIGIGIGCGSSNGVGGGIGVGFGIGSGIGIGVGIIMMTLKV